MKRKWEKLIIYAIQDIIGMFLIAIGITFIGMGMNQDLNITSIILLVIGVHAIIFGNNRIE